MDKYSSFLSSNCYYVERATSDGWHITHPNTRSIDDFGGEEINENYGYCDSKWYCSSNRMLEAQRIGMWELRH